MLSSCTNGSSQGSLGPSGGASSGSSGDSSGSGVTGGGGGAVSAGGAAGGSATAGGGGTGGVVSPGVQPSDCATPAPDQVFGLSSGSTISVPGPYVVLSGTLPPNINGSPVSSVEVKGSTRGVRMDAEHKL